MEVPEVPIPVLLLGDGRAALLRQRGQHDDKCPAPPTRHASSLPSASPRAEVGGSWRSPEAVTRRPATSAYAIRGLEARSVERVVRGPHAIPAMTERRQRELVHPALGPAVVLVENVDQKATVIGSGIDGERLPSAREVVESEHGYATEVVSDR